MEPIESVLKKVLDIHAGDVHLLALQLKASPASVQRWLNRAVKPRASYEAKLRKIHAELNGTNSLVHEDSSGYRVTPHHPMITEAVDTTLRTIREILHKRARLSSRSQALDELSKLLFTHVHELRNGREGISHQAIAAENDRFAPALKGFVDSIILQNLPESLAHNVDVRDFELKLKPQEDELANELIECFERLQRQTSSFSFRGFDILNEVFGKFLADSFIDERELGQYLTPKEVVRFMCSLAVNGLSPSEAATLFDAKRCAEFGLILDPSCGVGSFLAEIIDQLSERVDPTTGGREKWSEEMLGRVVVGVDKSERMVRLALTNLAMFGFPMARLYLANSLSRNGADGKLAETLVGKAKLILTNPPFGASFQGNDLVKYRIATRWSRRLPARLDSEILFMERYLDWLAPGGQLIAVVPDSVLTNQGIFEDLRRGISDEIDLCTVVSLPSVTFGTAGTNTKTSVVHIRKRTHTRKASPEPTAFAVCRDIGFTVSTKANQRVKTVQGEGDLPKIFRDLVSTDPKSSHVRWVPEASSLERWDAQHHASLTTEIEQRLNKACDEDVYVADVAELIDERADPRRWASKHFNYIEISDIDAQTCVVYTNSIEISATPSRARKLVKSGDVLVSTVRPERGTVGVVGSHQDNSICTTGLAVLRPKAIHSVVLANLLKTKFVTAQLIRNNVGIAYPAINESCLLGVLLPIDRRALESLEEQAIHIVDAEERVYRMRESLTRAIREAGEAWRQMSLTAGSKPPPAKRTTSRHQSRMSDSDSHDRETFRLEATHTV
jgi:type I restriction-modification system DNA methylase subunit